MNFTIITLYPELIKPYLDGSILGRAQKNDLLNIGYINPRDFGLGNYKQVDDTPYGGGAGMVLRPDVVIPAIEKAKNDNKNAVVVILSPDGEQFNQKYATDLSKEKSIILVCGRFEGFDERIKKYADKIISIGPYVLSGGELPALTVIESIARLIPRVLGNKESVTDESFSSGELEYPHYTKPENFRGEKVPDVLLSGDHAAIAKWRQAHKRKI